MKKLLPILLLALALGLAACSESSPAAQEETTSAEGSSDHTVITFDGSNVEIRGGGARDEGSAVAIRAAGTYEVTGVSSGDKTLVIDTGDDAMDVTLILNNADLTCLSGPAIHVKQAKHFRLRLAEGSENRLVSGTEELLQSPDPDASGAALYSEDDMDIEGEGSLAVYGYLNNGIGCKNDLDVNSGVIAVLAANNGVKGNDSVQIKGGSLTVTAWGDGIKSSATNKEGKGYVELSGGTVAIEAWGDGIQAATELRISGGSLTVTTRGDGVEHSSKALKAQDLVLLSGGSIALDTREDGVRSVDGNVEISGGILDILALGDGIRAGEKDSGLGDITVTGGTLTVSAGKQAAKARGSFTVTGGTLSALCGSEKQAGPVGCAYLLCALTGPEGDTVQIGELGSLNARQNYKSVLYVSGELNPGAEITVSNRLGSVSATVK